MNTSSGYVIVLLLVVAGCAAGCFLAEGPLNDNVHSIEISRWTDSLPDGTHVEVELKEPHTVVLKRGGTSVNLGTLERQFPNTPLKTMLIDTGNDLILVGYVDESVTEPLDSVHVSVPNPDHAPIPETKVGKVNERVFFLVIYSHLEERPYWNSIKQVIVYPDDTEASTYEIASKTEYDPPLDIQHLWIKPDLSPLVGEDA